MSFLDDLVGGVGSVLGGPGIGSALARTALAGLALRQLSKSINNDAATSQPDPGVRLQSPADPEKTVPVIYGSAVTGGILTDAVLSADNLTMYFCFTICEKTGLTDLGSGAASQFTFKGIYWNDAKLFFDPDDGVTVRYSEDRDGNKDTNIDGLIEVYCYAGNRSTPTAVTGYAVPTLVGGATADTIMPNWTTDHNMSDLVFAIVKMKYNKEKNVTSIGNFRFQIENSMKAAGDCLYDYLTNTRYGAGLNPSEIYVS
jgi:hypothetical protein